MLLLIDSLKKCLMRHYPRNIAVLSQQQHQMLHTLPLKDKSLGLA